MAVGHLGLADEAAGAVVEVGVEGAAEAAVGGDVEDADVPDGALGEEGMRLVAVAVLAAAGGGGGEGGEDELDLLRVGAALGGPLLGATHLGRGHELERVRDLGGIPNRPDAAAELLDGGHGAP